MITISHRTDLQFPRSATARYEGSDHDAGVSLFWVRTHPGEGPDPHWHPYTETWVVIGGEVSVDADDDSLRAGPGAIITVPAHTVHRFRNVGTTVLEMICIHASPTIIQDFVAPPPQR